MFSTCQSAGMVSFQWPYHDVSREKHLFSKTAAPFSRNFHSSRHLSINHKILLTRRWISSKLKASLPPFPFLDPFLNQILVSSLIILFYYLLSFSVRDTRIARRRHGLRQSLGAAVYVSSAPCDPSCRPLWPVLALLTSSNHRFIDVNNQFFGRSTDASRKETVTPLPRREEDQRRRKTSHQVTKTRLLTNCFDHPQSRQPSWPRC